jgi:hypothetical protein
MVISCRPSKLGSEVLTSMMICGRGVNNSPSRPRTVRRYTYLVGELDQLGSCAHTCTRHNAAVFLDVGRLYYYHIETFVGPIFGVESLVALCYFLVLEYRR